MPTRRTTETTFEQSHALSFLLMTGDECPTWLDGWYPLFEEYQGEHDRVRQDCWPREAATLTAEAKRYGFLPWGKTGREPHGPGVEQWKSDYIAAHGQHPASRR